MNDADYAASAACGACVAIDGPDGSTTVRIADRCPECPQGDIDLHPDAFAMLADPQLGVVPITWRYVSCPQDGDIVYQFKEGSNQWWTAVQIRDHRNAIATFAYKDAMGVWKDVARVDYNFFIDMAGMGPGDQDRIAALARRQGLAGSAGSDFHDPAVPWNPPGRFAKLAEGISPVAERFDDAQ